MSISAGKLHHRLRFESPEPLPEGDGFGNFERGWKQEFTVWAAMQPRFGGEAVIAARLSGTQPVTVTVRRSSATLRITPAWRIVDARTGAVYAITSPPADMAQDGACLEMLAVAGAVT